MSAPLKCDTQDMLNLAVALRSLAGAVVDEVKRDPIAGGFALYELRRTQRLVDHAISTAENWLLRDDGGTA